MEKIFTDEANPVPSVQIDFSSAINIIQINHIFNRDIKPNILKDVDVIVETENDLIFVEVKNSNRIDATKPNFKPKSDKKLNDVALKFYDSLLFTTFINFASHKRKIYCYLVEVDKGDSVLRNDIKILLADRLPFKLQIQNNLPTKMIDSLEVLSFDEWNQKFPQFPLTRLVDEITKN